MMDTHLNTWKATIVVWPSRRRPTQNDLAAIIDAAIVEAHRRGLACSAQGGPRG